MKVGKVPTDELSVKNVAVINDREPNLTSASHIEVLTSPAHRYVFTVARHPHQAVGSVGFSLPQRKWAMLSLNQDIEVRPFQVKRSNMYIAHLTLQASFFSPKKATTDPFNTDEMMQEFLGQFMGHVFTVGQQVVFQFENKPLLNILVKHIDVLNLEKGGQVTDGRLGVIYKETNVIFDKSENSPLNLVGKAKSKTAVQSIINPDWDFNKMGIGGLDKEFSAIFRRAFASRVFPPEIVQQLGMKHCRGILLYGPPGTGKTLMARQIGQMLNAREPKIINGPEILDKYVGESESKIRKLFEEAENEEKRLGVNSGLHIIIFDEIDAICKARGSMAGSTAVHDTVVNQLLSKIDGVEQLNNILVIGMTNRKDMIDEALIRPGRLEVQMEISLPNEEGRVQILNIHTQKMKENKKLTDDFDVKMLAKETKNFSGAEIEGLVRAAASTAMNRLIKASSKVEIDHDATENLKVSMNDFLSALKNDCKPAFGASEEQLNKYCSNGIIAWGDSVRHVLDDATLLVNQTRNSERTPLITVLLSGAPGTGKTALAAQIAKDSEFPFLKICSPENMVGFTEPAKCHAIKKIFDDAYKSPHSCIILDDIERLIDYVSIGPRFSNLVLQAILVLLNKLPPPGKKLLVIGTTSRREVLEQMEMTSSFTAHIHVSPLTSPQHVLAAVEDLSVFSEQEYQSIERRMQGRKCWLGIKKLIALSEMAVQTEPDGRVNKFLELMEEFGGLE